jgi:outer membrane protein assembly factor BamB
VVGAGANSVGERVRSAVLVVSLLTIAGGLALFALAQRRPGARAPAATSASAPPVYILPPQPTIKPTPEGAVAWDIETRAPVIANVNTDETLDVFGFFHVWDGRSAWIPYAGAFDGATMKMLWQTDPIDPRLLKQPGVVPLALVTGPYVVVGDTSQTLRVFKLATGEKVLSQKVGGPVMDVCAAPDKPEHVWVRVLGGPDANLDISTGKLDPAPRPKWCPEPAYQTAFVPPLPRRPTPVELAAAALKKAELSACVDAFENGIVSKAACRVPSIPTGDDGFTPSYELVNGPFAVAFGTKGGRPYSQSVAKGNVWSHGFALDDTNGKDGPPAVAEVVDGKVYVAYERVYFDQRLAALDAKTGAPLWDEPLIDSLPTSDGSGRGVARALVATPARVYVVRAGGALDVFDSASGKALGTIGKQ